MDFFLCGDFRESLSRVLGGEVGVFEREERGAFVGLVENSRGETF